MAERRRGVGEEGWRAEGEEGVEGGREGEERGHEALEVEEGDGGKSAICGLVGRGGKGGKGGWGREGRGGQTWEGRVPQILGWVSIESRSRVVGKGGAEGGIQLDEERASAS